MFQAMVLYVCVTAEELKQEPAWVWLLNEAHFWAGGQSSGSRMGAQHIPQHSGRAGAGTALLAPNKARRHLRREVTNCHMSPCSAYVWSAQPLALSHTKGPGPVLRKLLARPAAASPRLGTAPAPAPARPDAPQSVALGAAPGPGCRRLRSPGRSRRDAAAAERAQSARTAPRADPAAASSVLVASASCACLLHVCVCFVFVFASCLCLHHVRVCPRCESLPQREEMGYFLK